MFLGCVDFKIIFQLFFFNVVKAEFSYKIKSNNHEIFVAE